jgi:AAA+ superfamily predicted ATPase
MAEDLIASLLTALETQPGDIPLRLHVAGLLLQSGRPAQALGQVSQVLATRPDHQAALALLQQVTSALAPDSAPAPTSDPAPDSAPDPDLDSDPVAPEEGESAGREAGQEVGGAAGFDWSAAERELGGVDHPFAQPAFVDSDGVPDDDPLSQYEIERPTIRLADVGGMDHVKKRLDLAFLTPMRNPQLRQAFGKSLRGGLLLYGPPGCGKTFLARALAGELGARFASVSLADVLDMWIGGSERNVQSLFQAARRSAPCVLFLDEIDALGQKRSQMRGSAQRGSVNQLLTELDGVSSDNDGVFVLAATNAPWDVDPALRRPGRLDRMVLVLPPDAPAREAILRFHLTRRPVAGVDLAKLVRATEHFSGADLAHVVETAAESALAGSVSSGQIQPITMRELNVALKEVRPSTGAWFGVARNVAEFGNDHGEYDELIAYLKRIKML